MKALPRERFEPGDFLRDNDTNEVVIAVDYENDKGLVEIGKTLVGRCWWNTKVQNIVKVDHSKSALNNWLDQVRDKKMRVWVEDNWPIVRAWVEKHHGDEIK